MKWMLVMSTSVFLEYWQHFNFLGILHRHRMLLKLWKFKPATQLHPAETRKLRNLVHCAWEPQGKKKCRLASAFSAHWFIPLFEENKYCQLCHYREVLGVKDHHILRSTANLFHRTKTTLHPKYLEPVLLQHWLKVLSECNNFFSFSICNLLY